MSKRALYLKVRLPKYVTPRLRWRRLVYDIVERKAEEAGISYTKNDRLELNVKLYFEGSAISFHDVDNRLKDVMDALQGRIGGSKKIRNFRPVIPNDSLIYKVTVEKMLPPKQSHEMGHLIISKKDK